MSITEYRTKHGLSVEDLAKLCGLKRSTLAMIETGTTGCRLASARAIVHATNGEVGYEDIPLPPVDEDEENGTKPAAPAGQ